MTPEFNLELINGNWGIASLALALICGIYLRHEILARQLRHSGAPLLSRSRVTLGMRIAIALLTLSVGIFIRSAETWRWRMSGAPISDLSQGWLVMGDVIAVVGFLCAIREISSPLYGRAPWVCTLVAMVIFNVASVAYRFW